MHFRPISWQPAAYVPTRAPPRRPRTHGSGPGPRLARLCPRSRRDAVGIEPRTTALLLEESSAASRLPLGWLSAGSRLHLEARADAPRGLEEDVRRGLACSDPKSTAVLHVSPLASSIQGVPAATSCHFVPSRAISCNLAPAATSAAHTTFPSLELKMSASPALSRCRSTCSRNLLAVSFR